MLRIGLISDTHGLLRPAALHFLRGSDHIIHAGDIGPHSLLEELAALAPLTVVRGNNDTAPWARDLPATATRQLGEIRVLVVHDLKTLGEDPAAAGCRVVVAGHSHRPGIREKDGVLYVNPGSAGRRRFSLPVAAGELFIDGADVRARLVELPA